MSSQGSLEGGLDVSASGFPGSTPGSAVVWQQALELCEKIQFPGIYAQDVARLFADVERPPRAEEDRRALLGLCLYRVTVNERVPRTLSEIAALTDVAPRLLTRLASRYFPEPCYVDPVLLLPRFGQRCGLSRRETTQMLKRLKKSPLEPAAYFFGPQTVAASLIIDYCEDHAPCITPKLVRQVCGVSRTAITRLKQRLRRCSSEAEESPKGAKRRKTDDDDEPVSGALPH
jgi:transcription initiation factor TFIIIB Brf1 subunit/transcription initiation factor TFIIB